LKSDDLQSTGSAFDRRWLQNGAKKLDSFCSITAAAKEEEA
jgi:hypothetical protein